MMTIYFWNINCAVWLSKMMSWGEVEHGVIPNYLPMYLVQAWSTGTVPRLRPTKFDVGQIRNRTKHVYREKRVVIQSSQFQWLN